jgi:hypothetical protein
LLRRGVKRTGLLWRAVDSSGGLSDNPDFLIVSSIKKLGFTSLGRERRGEGRHGVIFLIPGVKCG